MINATTLLELDDAPQGASSLTALRALLARLADGIAETNAAETLCERAAQYGDSQPSYAADLRAAAACLAD